MGYNDNSVVKTVYDPSPVGFKMPASNAFTGFTTTGQNSYTQSELNVDGTSDWQTYQNNFGHNFWTSSSKTATIYFPASGYRYSSDGSLNRVGIYGCYWSAVPIYTNYGCYLSLISGTVYPLYYYIGLMGPRRVRSQNNPIDSIYLQAACPYLDIQYSFS